MKILITGSRGMVGRNLLDHYKSSSYEILQPTRKDLNLLISADIESYLKKYSPDMVIHAAGLVGGIQANITSQSDFFFNNVQIGLNIIMASKNYGIKNFMNLGSSCMYPRDSINPISEESILNGELEPTNEGYALAKISCAALCKYINNEDNRFHYKTVIPCNLFGKYDKFNSRSSHMIPAVIRKVLEAKNVSANNVEIWGDGTARREFMYAEDFSDFVFYAVENFERMPKILNVGLGFDHSINEYYKQISDVIGYKGKFIHDLTKPIGMKQKLIDISKLRGFGWEYKTTLEEGVLKTYNYFLQSKKNG
jgi:GDP-L-fucose synthase